MTTAMEVNQEVAVALVLGILVPPITLLATSLEVVVVAAEMNTPLVRLVDRDTVMTPRVDRDMEVTLRADQVMIKVLQAAEKVRCGFFVSVLMAFDIKLC